jgi:hypothetical protein
LGEEIGRQDAAVGIDVVDGTAIDAQRREQAAERGGAAAIDLTVAVL